MEALLRQHRVPSGKYPIGSLEDRNDGGLANTEITGEHAPEKTVDLARDFDARGTRTGKPHAEAHSVYEDSVFSSGCKLLVRP